MKNKIQSIINTLHASVIITPIIFATGVIFLALFFYIPYITEKTSIEMATKNSINSLNQIKMSRAYYVDAVVKDIKKHAPDIKFSYNHKGVDATLPLPTTTIHDLSEIFSKDSGIKYDLYSAYPFAFKKDRKLNIYQKEALEYIQNNDNEIYIKKFYINNKPVLRVAIADIMTDQACVDCHNTHPQRTWKKDFWKVGDKRGVLEVITPINGILLSSIKARNNILIFISIVGIILVAYISYILLKREKELIEANDELQKEFEDLKNTTSKALSLAKEKEIHMLKQNKMAQMGEMLSMIAHQWRQPLTAISSTASALELKILMNNYNEQAFRNAIKDIQAYSQHLSLTINDFRNFFRDSKVVTQTTFENIIDNTIQIVKTSLEAHDIILSIQNKFTEEFCIYENEFKQVTLNLIKNAEDAILESGVKNGFISIKTYKLNNNAIFEVSDNGGGISDEIMDTIFDPYFSTKDKKSGTGLGLYMSKTIIENHCLGSLECFNTQEGAMFRITIDPNKLHLDE